MSHLCTPKSLSDNCLCYNISICSFRLLSIFKANAWHGIIYCFPFVLLIYSVEGLVFSRFMDVLSLRSNLESITPFYTDINVHQLLEWFSVQFLYIYCIIFGTNLWEISFYTWLGSSTVDVQVVDKTYISHVLYLIFSWYQWIVLNIL